MKIEHEEIDLAAAPNNRQQMLAKIPDDKKTPPILPPQVFSDLSYLGDYDAFFEAREQELPFTWLKLTPPAGSREEQMVILFDCFINLFYLFILGCRIQIDQRPPAILSLCVFFCIFKLFTK